VIQKIPIEASFAPRKTLPIKTCAKTEDTSAI